MRNDRLLLHDILEAITVIEKYLPESEDTFLADPPVQSHILRHLQIIGEACNHLSPALRANHPHIPWIQIIGMRNVTVHHYAAINWHRVFQTAYRDVPLLKPQIEAILKTIPPETMP